MHTGAQRPMSQNVSDSLAAYWIICLQQQKNLIVKRRKSILLP